MNFEKRMQKRGNEKLDSYTPNLYENKKSFPLWAKISILVGSVAITTSIALIIAFPVDNNILKKHALNAPQKVFNSTNEVLSESYKDAINHFANDYYISEYYRNYIGPTLNGKQPDNYVFSPIAITNTLYMFYDGLTGEVKDDVAKVLYLDESKYNHLKEIRNMINNLSMDFINKDDGTYIYSNVSQAFLIDNKLADNINEEYIDLLSNYYFSEIYRGPLPSLEMLNVVAEYISSKTNNNYSVTPHLDDFSFGGDIQFINLVYFESNWGMNFATTKIPFDFYNCDGSVSTCSYLSGIITSDVYEGENYVLISIPLLKNYSFNILLPKEESDYQYVLRNDFINLLSKNYTSKYEALIYVKIPEFDVQTFASLGWAAQYLKLDKLFENKGDFNNIFSNKKANIGPVSNCASIKVNVNGIRGIAITENDYVVPVSSTDLPIYHFIVDRPFIYSITSPDNVPLFAGNIQTI